MDQIRRKPCLGRVVGERALSLLETNQDCFQLLMAHTAVLLPVAVMRDGDDGLPKMLRTGGSLGVCCCCCSTGGLLRVFLVDGGGVDIATVSVLEVARCCGVALRGVFFMVTFVLEIEVFRRDGFSDGFAIDGIGAAMDDGANETKTGLLVVDDCTRESQRG